MSLSTTQQNNKSSKKMEWPSIKSKSFVYFHATEFPEYCLIAQQFSAVNQLLKVDTLINKLNTSSGLLTDFLRQICFCMEKAFNRVLKFE